MLTLFRQRNPREQRDDSRDSAFETTRTGKRQRICIVSFPRLSLCRLLRATCFFSSPQPFPLEHADLPPDHVGLPLSPAPLCASHATRLSRPCSPCRVQLAFLLLKVKYNAYPVHGGADRARRVGLGLYPAAAYMVTTHSTQHSTSHHSTTQHNTAQSSTTQYNTAHTAATTMVSRHIFFI